MIISHLVLLVFAFVLAVASVVIGGPGFTWQRAIGASLAFLAASFIQW